MSLTDFKHDPDKVIESINYSLTTYCNMKCPDCCADMHRKPYAFYSLDYIRQSAEMLNPIKRIGFTGGEPTIHPKFKEIVANAREWFGCECLGIETNALAWGKVKDSLELLDEIGISHYRRESFPAHAYDGDPDNTRQVNEMVTYFTGKHPRVFVGEIVHYSRDLRGTKRCSRGDGTSAGFCDGVLYPCCVAPGIPSRVGIPLTKNWRQEIKQVAAPCADCFFAEH